MTAGTVASVGAVKVRHTITTRILASIFSRAMTTVLIIVREHMTFLSATIRLIQVVEDLRAQLHGALASMIGQILSSGAER